MMSVKNFAERRLRLELVGREGIVGLPLTLSARMPTGHIAAQGAGTGLRMSVSALRTLLKQNVALHDRLHRYTSGLLAQSEQTAYRNNQHTVRTRLASLLLQIGDCASSDDFDITQSHLGALLVVRRAGLSNAASELRRRNLIGYSRGRISSLARARLQAASCGCNLRRKQERRDANDVCEESLRSTAGALNSLRNCKMRVPQVIMSKRRDSESFMRRVTNSVPGRSRYDLL